MSQFWLRVAATLIYPILFSVLIGLAAGWAVGLGVLSAILLTYLLIHMRYLGMLERWLKDPQARSVPEGGGLWEHAFSSLYQLMRIQSRSQSKLSAAVDRFQSAAQAIPDGVVILGEDDEIQWCNPVAERHLGVDNRADQGRPIKYLLRQTAFTEYLASQNYAEPAVMKSPTLHDTTLSIQLVPFGDAQKLLLSRDISALERVVQMRRDFVANVSHELRTPLTVVGGFLETLLDNDSIDSAERRHFEELMLDQTKRMQNLVQDLLTLSKLESSDNAGTEECIDMRRLLRSLNEDAKSLSAGQHTIEFVCEFDVGLVGSEAEIHSALSNLVSNAIRYTPPGGHIKASWGRRGADAVFAVEDDGPGIDAQHLPRLTERFYRVDRSRSRETGGTGLGLSIVKHVLTRHQARLEIQSTPGKGSLFTAVFPARRVSTQTQATLQTVS